MPPLISAIACNYNQGEFIVDAVESVLANSDDAIEVVVVDDGSTDSSRENLERYRSHPKVKLVFQENKGQPGAFNAGVAAAQGEVLAIFDGDDFWFPHKARTIRETIAQLSLGDKPYLLRHPLLKLYEKQAMVRPHEPLLAFTASGIKTLEIGSLTQTHQPASSLQYIADHFFPLYGGGGFGGSTVLNRTMAEAIYPMPEIAKYYGDAIPMYAAPLVGDVYVLARQLGIYRYHGENHSFGRQLQPLNLWLGIETYVNDLLERMGSPIRADFIKSEMARPYLIGDRKFKEAIAASKLRFAKHKSWSDLTKTYVLTAKAMIGR